MTIYVNHEGKAGDGSGLVQILPTQGRRCDVVTHDFTKRQTWYQESIRVTDGALLDSGDHQTYKQVSDEVWIDLIHGYIYNEDELISAHGIVVKVDGSVKVQNSPVGTGGDYSVDCLKGWVTFNTPLAGTETVTATRSVVGSGPRASVFHVVAPTGCVMRNSYVEMQFSIDIVLNDTLCFQLWGLVDAFAPELIPDIPSGTLIPLTSVERYKTMHNFIVDAEKSYPPIPVFSAPGNWRHYTQPVIPFRFDYTSGRTATELVNSAGMEIQVWLENDIPCGGEFAQGTFYAIKILESS